MKESYSTFYKSKDIEVRHHFICDSIDSKVVLLEYITPKIQFAYIFTKTLDASRFDFLRKVLGIGSM